MKEINDKSVPTSEGRAKKSTLFSMENIKSYIITLFILFGIIGAYYFFLSFTSSLSSTIRTGPPSGNNPLSGSNPLSPMSPFSMNGIELWPFWGTFSIPTLSEILIFAGILISFIVLVWYYFKGSKKLTIYAIVFMGTILIIFTNLISGWETGIVNPIGGNTEIYQDAIQITNPISFISNFTSIQNFLSVHAKTQPPGAVLTIYALYVLFNSPGIIAIAICIFSALLSAFFLHGIFKKFFKGEIPKYMVFMYLLLPAIQVYYLANIYAIVTTLVIGTLYFYFHENLKVSIIGSILCCFLATFISFMACFIIVCLCIYEFFTLRTKGILRVKTLASIKGFKNMIKESQRIIFLLVGIIGLYGLLMITLGFNYINSFAIATASETAQGWKLITNPTVYLTTRIKDIMDILMFFGPVLIVLLYKGFKLLRKERKINHVSSQLFSIVSAAIITLLLIFVLGAYDHGETARAAMFIYPFLLIPVAYFIKSNDGRISKYESGILLFIVFGQALLFQLFGSFIW